MKKEDMGKVIKRPFGRKCIVCTEMTADTEPRQSDLTPTELVMVTMIINLVAGYPLEDLYNDLCSRHRGLVDGFLVNKG